MTIYAHAGDINTTKEDLVVVTILVLITLAHLQVANQGLAGNSEPVSLERRYPAAGGQIFVHGILELKTRSASAIIQSERFTKASSESASFIAPGIHTFC